jgi:hypothetical protein
MDKVDGDHADVPLTVELVAVAGIGAMVRSGQRPAVRAAHAARSGGSLARMAAAVAGLAATVVAVGIGTAALVAAPLPVPSAPGTAQHITVTRPPAVIPLSDAQILALLDHAPDYGPLADVQRRASCFSGLGYPATAKVLAARPIEVTGRPAELLVLPGAAPGTLAVLAVTASCSSANTGLLADRVVDHP